MLGSGFIFFSSVKASLFFNKINLLYAGILLDRHAIAPSVPLRIVGFR